MVEPQPSSGAAEAEARQSGAAEGRGELQPATDRSRQPAAPGHDGFVVIAPPDESAWLGAEHRRLERYSVQASRPIAVRLVDADGQPQGRWFLADILDISRGGLCLLVSGPMQLPPAQLLQLDVRCHPDFGQNRLQCQMRWCRSSIGFSTLGLAFSATMSRVPRLEVERRTVRRDPNDEPWAQE